MFHFVMTCVAAAARDFLLACGLSFSLRTAGPEKTFVCAAFSPDGKQIVTGRRRQFLITSGTRANQQSSGFTYGEQFTVSPFRVYWTERQF